MIETGFSISTHFVGDDDAQISVRKPLSEWTKEEKLNSQHNKKGKNDTFQAINATEFKRISACTSSKEAWDILMTTHEGDSRVKRAKSQILVRMYDSLFMKDNEKFDEFYLKLQDILNP